MKERTKEEKFKNLKEDLEEGFFYPSRESIFSPRFKESLSSPQLSTPKSTDEIFTKPIKHKESCFNFKIFLPKKKEGNTEVKIGGEIPILKDGDLE